MLYVLFAIAGLTLLAGLWWLFAPGPRYHRAFGRAQRLLERGLWQEAIRAFQALQAQNLSHSTWQQQLRAAAGQCHEAGGESALGEQRYEDALEHFQKAADLRRTTPAAGRARVIEAMLGEVQRLLGQPNEPDQAAAIDALLERILAVQPECPQAYFWQGLCRARQGDLNAASTSWTTAHDQAGRLFIDPPLYLGMALHRLSRPLEALHYLSEAHRLDPDCPLVACQTGISMVAAGGDSGTAVRTLQRGLGPEGLERWHEIPERVWIDALPENRSFIRRLATRYHYVCPFLGGDLTLIARQSEQALAEAHYRQGAFTEAAELYGRLLQEVPPTAPLLRGLGLSLARQERYDQAYKHLRTALDMEEPKDPLTAAYLALSGALGKPTQPADRPKNVAWALRLLAKSPAKDNSEWTGLCSRIHREAREIGLTISRDDQLLLCDALAANEAADGGAAAAYAHLAASFPDAPRQLHAWLYVRAASQGQPALAGDLAFFDLAFADRPALRSFFAGHGWDLDEAEWAYLVRAAAQRPGGFPPALGTDFPVRAIEMLLNRSRREETAGRLDAALASVEMLRRLAPHNLPALDRLAGLCFHAGQLERAVTLLREWHQRASVDPLPLVRRALLEHHRGHILARDAKLKAARKRSSGRVRAAVAFLGARLELQGLDHQAVAASMANLSVQIKYDQRNAVHVVLANCAEMLKKCLQSQPNHAEALWCLAAVRLAFGARAALAALSPLMDRAEQPDARFHYLSAICHLAARDQFKALVATDRAALDPNLASDCAYLRARALLMADDVTTARVALAQSANVDSGSSAPLSRALLGRLAFLQGDFGEAVRRWQAVGPSQRTAWRLEEPLRQTALVAGLRALAESQYEQAAEFFYEAGRLGLRDQRMSELIAYALVKAGQRLLFKLTVPGRDPSAADLQAAARALEQAVQAGCQDPQALMMLALAYKRQVQSPAARRALRRIAQPRADDFLQLGLLSLRDKQLAQAETEFAQARELDPQSYPAVFNLLLVELLLGKLDACRALLPPAMELAASRDPAERHFLSALHALLQINHGGEASSFLAPLADLSSEEEHRLLDLLASLGQLDTVLPLLGALQTARPGSESVRLAYCEAVLVKSKQLADRCLWSQALRLLKPLTDSSVAPPLRPALHNLLGVCACMTRDFAGGIREFGAAARLAGTDARLHQNLALAHELAGDLGKADPYWNRFFDLVESATNGAADLAKPVQMPTTAGYGRRLAFEGFTRLTTSYVEKEKWSTALGYIQRAVRLEPDDFDALERLFHLATQSRQFSEARHVLGQLRRVRPSEPQLDLYELDLTEVKTLADLEKQLNEIQRVRERRSGDARIEERAAKMVGDAIAFMTIQCDQLTDQLSRVAGQVRNVPAYEVNWGSVREVLRELLTEFQRLRRIIGRCLPLVGGEDQRRVLRDLGDHVDRKMEACRTIGA